MAQKTPIQAKTVNYADRWLMNGYYELAFVHSQLIEQLHVRFLLGDYIRQHRYGILRLSISASGGFYFFNIVYLSCQASAKRLIPAFYAKNQTNQQKLLALQEHRKQVNLAKEKNLPTPLFKKVRLNKEGPYRYHLVKNYVSRHPISKQQDAWKLDKFWQYWVGKKPIRNLTRKKEKTWDFFFERVIFMLQEGLNWFIVPKAKNSFYVKKPEIFYVRTFYYLQRKIAVSAVIRTFYGSLANYVKIIIPFNNKKLQQAWPCNKKQAWQLFQIQSQKWLTLLPSSYFSQQWSLTMSLDNIIPVAFEIFNQPLYKISIKLKKLGKPYDQWYSCYERAQETWTKKLSLREVWPQAVKQYFKKYAPYQGIQKKQEITITEEARRWDYVQQKQATRLLFQTFNNVVIQLGVFINKKHNIILTTQKRKYSVVKNNLNKVYQFKIRWLMYNR